MVSPARTASASTSVAHAAMAVSAGLANYVLIMNTSLSPRGYARNFPHGDGWAEGLRDVGGGHFARSEYQPAPLLVPGQERRRIEGPDHHQRWRFGWPRSHHDGAAAEFDEGAALAILG